MSVTFSAGHQATVPPVHWRALGHATLRQHRGALAGVGLPLVGFGVAIALEASSSHVSSQLLLQQGGIDTGRLSSLDFGVMLVPALLGVFVGAPLVAREIESGTYRFTWTQSVGRTRLVLGVLSYVMTAAMVAAAVLGAFLGWDAHPYEVVGVASRWQAGFFVATPLLLPAWTSLALGIGVLVGSILQRTVAAMAATAAAVAGLLAAFYAVLLPAMLSVAPVVTPIGAPDQIGLGNLAAPAPAGTEILTGSWLVRSWLVGSGGHPVGGSAAGRLYSQWAGASKGAPGAAAVHGYRLLVASQPPDRFWVFQVVAATALLLLGVAAVALAIRRLRRFG